MNDDKPTKEECLSKLVKNHFPNGFNIESNKDMRKLRDLYKEETGKWLKDNNKSLIKKIENMGIKDGPILYHGDLLPVQIRKEILKRIEKYLNEGHLLVYYRPLFDSFYVSLKNTIIDSPEKLKTFLDYFYNDKFSFKKNYLTPLNGKTSLQAEIEENLDFNGKPLTIDEIKDQLPNVDSEALEKTIGYRLSSNDKTYFNKDILDLTKNDLINLKELIDNELENRDYLMFAPLLETIKEKLPLLYEKNNFLTPLGLKKLIENNLSNDFETSKYFLTKKGKALSKKDVLSAFGKEKGQVTLDEFKDFYKSLNLTYRPKEIDIILDNYFRINENIFIPLEKIKLDPKEIDRALNYDFKEDFMGLKEVDYLENFPGFGFPWNIYSLESYLKHFSQDFKLLNRWSLENSVLGAVVRKNSSFRDIVDVEAAALNNDNISLDEKEAIKHLASRGFRANTYSKNIKKVIKKAQEPKDEFIFAF